MKPPRFRFRPTISLRAFLLLSLLLGVVAPLVYQWQARRQTDQSRIVETQWNIATGENVLWSAQLGSQTYSTPAVARGKVFVGSNNGAGHVKRWPSDVDLGVMLCFDAASGKFLWQHSSPKLATGRVNDWPQQGVCSSPRVVGDRLWYTSNRGVVVCLDTEGFHDQQNDGPVTNEKHTTLEDADVVWELDLIGVYSASPHNMSCGDCLIQGDRLFLVVPNGVDESHQTIPSPNAPAFMCLDKDTGKVLWSDSSSSAFIEHGQWGSPAAARLAGRRQVLFPGGDGWLYSFTPGGDGRGGGQLLWKFDCNPKTSKWILGGRGKRNNLIRASVIHNGLVYIAVGQDPEHGEGDGRLVCIDPSGRGDVSSELVVDKDGRPVPRRRGQLCDPSQGEKAVPNPNSALVWEYTHVDTNGDGQRDFEETLGRTLSQPAIQGDLLAITDLAGLVHCLDARTGKVHWVHDLFAGVWSSPMIAGEHIYVTDEDGVVTVFGLSGDPQQAMKLGTPLAQLDMDDSVYSTPQPANNVLYVVTRRQLYAIGKPKQP